MPVELGEELAREEGDQRGLHMVKGLQVLIGASPRRIGAKLRLAKFVEDLRDRAGVETGPQEGGEGFAMAADADGLEILRAVGLVKLPVLFELPGEETEDAGDAPDNAGGVG